jgi:quercetin dioxygenase-like cupin family protein
MTQTRAAVAILDGSAGPKLDIVDGAGEARAIIWPGTGARARALHHLWLEAGARTVQLRHPGEAVYYVVAGQGSVSDESSGERHPLREGSMFHVDAGTSYVAKAGDHGMELVGGPAPVDPQLYPDGG